MGTIQDLELLKAAIAVAVADGKITRSEMGVLKGLAMRCGIGQASFDAMIEVAPKDKSFADGVLLGSDGSATKAVQLLVAQARIDGEIAPQEREVLVTIASACGLTGSAFQEVYKAGIQQADKIRAARKLE
jgi:tellurite resistance protein